MDESTIRTSPVRGQLPSGRSLSTRTRNGNDEIEVRSAAGEIELKITLTPDGPLLSLKGARMEIESTDTVALRCRRFELETADGMALRSGGSFELESTGDLRARSRGEMKLDGDYVHLNCGDRTGYHDDPAALEPRTIEAQPTTPPSVPTSPAPTPPAIGAWDSRRQVPRKPEPPCTW